MEKESYIGSNYIGTRTLNRFHMSDAFVKGLMGPYGCMSFDTKYLGVNGWRNISEWEGEAIGEYDKFSGRVIFKKPLNYIMSPCDEFISFSSKRLDMVLSPEHRVLVRDKYGELQVRSAFELYCRHLKYNRIDDCILGSFIMDSGSELPVSDTELRLLVAISADGSFRDGRKSCTFCLKKERKKKRLRLFLDSLGIRYTETSYSNGKTYFYFHFARNIKDFTSWYYQASSHQLHVICEEVVLWDGHIRGDGFEYYTTNRENAEFIQYCFVGTNRFASLKIRDRDGRKKLYRVWGSLVSRDLGFSRESGSVKRVLYGNGYKYCFTTSTGFFVAKRNDKIFITGNSAKSTACCMEILHRGCLMPVFPGTNERRTKWAIIRATYPELHGTVLETWKKVLPLRSLELKLGNREQPSVTVDFIHEDGSRINIRMQLFALDNPKLVDKLGSYEYTGAWINEAREIPREIFDALTGRVGRYPGKIIKYDENGEAVLDSSGKVIEVPYWTGIIMDTNPPDIDHWWYKLAEERCPRNYEFFQQPPALLKNLKNGAWVPNPNAENVENLPGGYKYYFNQIGGKDEAWIRVYVQGRYGTLSAGKPVFPMYDDKDHYEDTGRNEFSIFPTLPILAGVDYGFNSAVVFAQMAPGGQLRVIDEIYVDNITTRDFIHEYVKPYLANNFKGMKIEWYGDPSGDTRSSVAGGTGAMEYINQGIPISPAPTNLINPRIQAVTTFLNRKDGFKMSNKCTLLRMGFQGEYCFERVMVSAERYRDKPTKNHKSCHIHDALQYICISVDPTYTHKRFSKTQIQSAPYRWGA